ncbi:unnamed protein product [Calypogeia fissa]
MASGLVRGAVSGGGGGAAVVCGGRGGHISSSSGSSRPEVEHGRGGVGEGAGYCSGWNTARFQRSGAFAEVGKLGIEAVHFGAGWRYGSGAAARTRLSQLQGRELCSRGPGCLRRGMNGAFWEGADSSESPANVHFTSQNESSLKEGSVLLSLIREIEPLDISLISKDASPDSTSAMKRTISGMLGLLPSDQFQVTIETPPDHLARLLVSSMMTGYTLRNAEYRLCLQRNLDLLDDETNDSQDLRTPRPEDGHAEAFHSDNVMHSLEAEPENLNAEEEVPIPEELGDVSSETASYILQLQAKLSAASKELEDCKNALSSLELMRQEKNDLLDYLRSLQPEKVAELSQPSPEVHEVVEQVVARILGTMIPKETPPVPPFGTSTLTSSWEENGSADVIGNIPLQFQSSVALTSSRDYLARLLFWCTLLGYHMRGLEYRLELSRTLSLSGEGVLDVEDDRQDTQ